MNVPMPSSRRRDQADRLRHLARRRRGTRRMAIVSGKGGVGKSNIAVNLAISVAQRGQRVVLVDLDMGLANADLLMKLQPRYSLAHLIRGVRTVDDICIDAPGGIKFVPGASGTAGLANLSEFERENLLAQLSQLDRSTDMAIYDCGAGISQSVLGFALGVDDTFVVTTPQPTAMTDAYATIKTLRRLRCEGRISLFVNMADSRAVAQATFDRVASVAQKFLNYSVANGGYMLHDSCVERAVLARSPFVLHEPGSNASACIAAVAASLTKSAATSRTRGGLFQRVAGLFV